jgi:hypothetical protein
MARWRTSSRLIEVYERSRRSPDCRSSDRAASSRRVRSGRGAGFYRGGCRWRRPRRRRGSGQRGSPSHGRRQLLGGQGSVLRAGRSRREYELARPHGDDPRRAGSSDPPARATICFSTRGTERDGERRRVSAPRRRESRESDLRCSGERTALAVLRGAEPRGAGSSGAAARGFWRCRSDRVKGLTFAFSSRTVACVDRGVDG